MRYKLLTTSLAFALVGVPVSASALTLADLGLPGDPYDFQIKFNNYEVLDGNTDVGSGVSNTDGLYLGDSFGIFRVTTILDAEGLNPQANWASGGITGSSIMELTGVFWGFDIVLIDGTTAFATGGSIALFANATWDVSIREQGPAEMVTSGSTTVGAYEIPTYTGITGGDIVLLGNYASGCNPLEATHTLCSPAFVAAGGSFLGAAKGYVDVVEGVGLWENFATGSILTDTPGLYRDLSVQSNFTPASLSGLPGADTSNWPVWSFDPVFGRTVPEPGILALIGIGLMGLGAARGRGKLGSK